MFRVCTGLFHCLFIAGVVFSRESKELVQERSI